MSPASVLLVDDHAVFRTGLRTILESVVDFQVEAQAADGQEGIEKASEASPDLVLLDINMPRCSGLEALEAIRQAAPQAKVVMLTVSDDNRDLFTAIKRGADGYLLKNIDPQVLLDQLRAVLRGEAPISGVLATKILREFRDPQEASPGVEDGMDALTEREAEILGMLTQGLTNAEIAEKVFVTESTVKSHLRAVLEKLHLRNRVQAAVYATRRGLDQSALDG